VSDLLVSLIVFACIFGGSLLGMVLGWALPHRHLGLALSGAVFLILEMDQPYSGVVKIPGTGLRIALEQLGRS
jgi:uncharacterized membrane protein (Fun14 family)